MKKELLVLNKKKESLKEFLSYLIVMVVTLLLLIRLYHLYNADLNVPYSYAGDAMGWSTYIKNYINGGGLYNFPQMGAPFTAKIATVPNFNLLYSAIFMLLSKFSSSYGFILNTFYLATFPLIAVTAFFALRQFGINRFIAAFGSVLYAYLPEHMYRNQSHLTLGNFFLVPIVAVLLIWVMKGDMYDKTVNIERFSLKTYLLSLRNKKMLFGICACFIIGITDLYYAFFACLFLAFASIYVWVSSKKFRSSLPSVFCIICIIIGVTVTLIPYYAVAENTSSLMSANGRVYAETEYYALKLSHLLMPIKEHRILAWGQLTNDYLSSTPLNTENVAAALGMIGSIGFIYSIFIVIFNKSFTIDKRIESFSKLNLFSVLLSIAGGGSLFIAMFLTSAIRCYNRTSVFIAIFSIAVICLLLQELMTKINKKGIMALFIVGVLLLGYWGIYDQTGMLRGVDFSSNKKAYYNDEEYVKKIESIVPKNAMIFSMPVFTEENLQYDLPRNRMGLYEIRRLYLHSDNLRWNINGDRGTKVDKWQYEVGTKSVNQMLEYLAFAGFSGISIDKYGYTDDECSTLEAELQKQLRVEPVNDSMGRYAFYDLNLYIKGLRVQYTEEEWDRYDYLDMIIYYFSDGFYPVETSGMNWFVWSKNKSTIIINNGDSESEVEMSASIAPFYQGPYNLAVSANGEIETIKIHARSESTPELSKYKLMIALKPGKNKIELYTNAPCARPEDLAGDTRDQIVFRIDDLQFKKIKK